MSTSSCGDCPNLKPDPASEIVHEFEKFIATKPHYWTQFELCFRNSQYNWQDFREARQRLEKRNYAVELNYSKGKHWADGETRQCVKIDRK
jgi:hypothetical protein